MRDRLAQSVGHRLHFLGSIIGKHHREPFHHLLHKLFVAHRLSAHASFQQGLKDIVPFVLGRRVDSAMLVRAVDGVVLAKVDAPGNLTEQGIQLIVRVEEPGVEDAVAQGVGKFLPVDARGRLDAASKSEVHMLDGEVAIDSYAIVVAIDIDTKIVAITFFFPIISFPSYYIVYIIIF